VGKATVAYRFARMVLGRRLVDPQAEHPLAMPAGDPVFRQIAAGIHPELLVLRRPWDEKTKRFKTELPVAEVRRIYPFFGRRAGEGGFRLCIVDAADDLNASAANALLKLLEEPPTKGIFLIIAHAPARLLATIRSRCRRLYLKPVEERLVSELLAREAPELGEADRRALARLAEGCPGRALALARGDGLSLYREVAALFAQLPDVDAPKLHALADRLARPSEEQAYARALSFLRGWLNRLACHAALAPAAEILAGEEKVLTRLAAPAHLEGWADLWESSSALIKRAEALKLDRKQTILSIVYAAARAAQGAPGGL
jgi:DNA polymerase-3 subunit delta'